MRNKLFFFAGAGAIMLTFAYCMIVLPEQGMQAIARMESDIHKAELNNYSDSTLKAKYNEFVENAMQHGVDLTSTLSKPATLIFTNERYGGMIGGSWAMHCDERIQVAFIQAKWNELSPARQKLVFYHELAHDIFNLEHDSCRLMAARVSMNPTMDHVDNMITEMFNLVR